MTSNLPATGSKAPEQAGRATRCRVVKLVLFLMLLVFPAFAQAPRPTPPAQAVQVAIVRAVDKVTGRAATLEIRVGETAEFRTLRILVRACVRRPPEEPPETSAFLEITERRDNQDRRLFSGWMFATAPGVVTLDHPLYDVWLGDCRTIPGA